MMKDVERQNNPFDLTTVVWLFTLFNTLWALGTTATAMVGDTLIENLFRIKGYPAPHLLVVVPLCICASMLLWGMIIRSAPTLLFGNVLGGVLCIANASFVFPVLAQHNAGPEMINWINKALMFLTMAVLITRQKKDHAS